MSPRSERLLRHADFERVYKLGKRHFGAHMTVFYLAQEPPQRIRVGFTVSKALGGAVVRNRMRRRLREAVRLTSRNEIAADVVINPKKSLLQADFKEIQQDVKKAFEIVKRKCAEPAGLN